jgi:hypothetical protein
VVRNVLKIKYQSNRLIKKQMMRRRRWLNMKKPSLRRQHAMRPLNISMHCSVSWRVSQRCLNKYGKPSVAWRITFFNTFSTGNCSRDLTEDLSPITSQFFLLNAEVLSTVLLTGLNHAPVFLLITDTFQYHSHTGLFHVQISGQHHSS